MDYVTDLLATFLDLDNVRTLTSMGGSKNSRNASKYLNLCSEDEHKCEYFLGELSL